MTTLGRFIVPTCGRRCASIGRRIKTAEIANEIHPLTMAHTPRAILTPTSAKPAAHRLDTKPPSLRNTAQAVGGCDSEDGIV